MKIEAKILLPHVYMLNFETQYELCLSFVRMQEFYESPKFREKYFTLEEYINYWCKEFGHGAFTYLATWSGFNVPGKVMYDWMNKFEEDISINENAILKQVYKLLRKEIGFVLEDDIDSCYIIGTYGKKNSVAVEHELAHAMYCLYPEYRNSCKKILRRVSKEEYQKSKNKLIEMGYCNKMIDDELQAYFSTGDVQYGKNILGSKIEFVNNFNDFKTKIKISEK